MAYSIRRIQPFDQAGMAQVRQLLQRQGIALEAGLDYTAAVYEEGGSLAAAGSFLANTLRCLAVDGAYQGEGLLNLVVSHLLQELAQRRVFHVFVYTKPENATFFAAAGFYEVAAVPGAVVLMENQREGFARYLDALSQQRLAQQPAAAVVMNANPFTLGHLYLVQKAAQENGVLHLFVVSEERSLFPFAARLRLVREGTAHLKNIVYHPTGHYLVSSATFPSYFIHQPQQVTLAHARLDAAVFVRMARALDIRARYVGEEPYSPSTHVYNQAMAQVLPGQGIALRIIARKTDAPTNQAISASRVRELMVPENWAAIRELVPPTTYAYIISEEGRALAQTLRQSPSLPGRYS